MIKPALATLVALFIAVVGGAASVRYALSAGEGLGVVTAGEWVARPSVGTASSNPYASARIALEGTLLLGGAEGLSFVARRDREGQSLRLECDYRVAGALPPARFWTLYAADASLVPLASERPRRSDMHAFDVLREADNSVVIEVASAARPGNWLAVSGRGALALVLTLYDTPLSGGGSGLSQIVMPAVIRVNCLE